MARKDPSPQTSIPYVPSQNVQRVKSRRSLLTHTVGGLPPGGIASLYDKLYQRYENNSYKSVIVGTYIIDDSGVLKLKNLRDSVYSLQFQELENIKYNILDIQVGNPDLYQTVIDNLVPYPVIITGIQSGLDIEDQAFLTISWVLDEHQTEGFYEIWAKKSGLDYHKWTTLYTPQARSYNLVSLDYDTWYYVLVKTINSDGLSRGMSNVVSGLTFESTFSGTYEADKEAPTGAQFYV